MSNGNTIYIIDGSAYVYRAFYAIRHLTNDEGFPTNALYGFVNMLKKLINQEDPAYLAVALDDFDREERSATYRHDLYDEYKANRSAMPDDLVRQLPYFSKILEAFDIAVLSDPYYEADDVIATLTRKARADGMEVCIVSADKDLMQLIGDHVMMIDTMRDRTFTEEEVLDKFNVPPDKVKYVMALSGDTSDNIPGVPGIGPVTGGKLVDEFGDLETILENIDEVGGKKRKQNLREYADQARLSLELVRLHDDLDIEFDREAFALGSPDIPEMTRLFDELGFESTLRSLKKWMDRHGWDVEQVDEQLEQLEADSFEEADKDYRAIFDLEELDELVETLRGVERFAFDLETDSVDALSANIVGMSFAFEPHAGVYVPCAHSYDDAPDQLSLDEVLERVTPLLEDPDLAKVGQHFKYEWLVLKRYDIEYRGVVRDTMLMSYLLDPTRTSQSLDALAADFLNYKTASFEEIAGKGKKQLTFDQIDLEVATPYAAEDADVALLLCDVLEPRLVEEELVRLHDDFELPLARVLGVMERTGVCIDQDILDELREEFEVELTELEDQINEHAGREINPNSPKQLREVLFDDLELPVQRRTKTGPSTAQSVLEKLAPMHPLPELILEYRSFAKLQGTYVDALPELVREDTGRIHTDFNQAVTATGRLSSSNPNLQNIPIRTARGRQIRRAFVPQDGWTMLAADYSQIELRILAHMSGDPQLLDAYRNGRDVHALTAANIFDVDIDEVTGEQRGVGKTINFGVLYGMGAHRLSNALSISHSQASEYIDEYFERFEGVADFFDQLVEQARDHEAAYTLFGRKRPLPELAGSGGRRRFAERVARNTPIQGTAADIIKLAMIRIQDEIERRDAPIHMLLQVHDELVFELDPDFLDEGRQLVRELMEGAADLDIPLEVDIGVGPTWLDAK